jgi:hypothetical protein
VNCKYRRAQFRMRIYNSSENASCARLNTYAICYMHRMSKVHIVFYYERANPYTYITCVLNLYGYIINNLWQRLTLWFSVKKDTSFMQHVKLCIIV